MKRMVQWAVILGITLLGGIAWAQTLCFQIPGTGKCYQVPRDGSGKGKVVKTTVSRPEQPQAPGASDAGVSGGSNSR